MEALLLCLPDEQIEKLSVRADGQMDRQTDNYKGHKRLTQAANFPSVWVMRVWYQQGNA